MLTDDFYQVVNRNHPTRYQSAAAHAAANREIYDRNVIKLNHIDAQIANIGRNAEVAPNGVIIDDSFLHFARRPIAYPMSAVAYEALTTAWDLHLITDTVFKQWHDLVFAGFTPDALTVSMAKSPRFWTFVNLKARPQPTIPGFQYSEDIFYDAVTKPDGVFIAKVSRTLLSTEVSGTHPLKQPLLQYFHGGITAHELYKVLQPWHVQHSKMLMVRQRIGLQMSCDQLKFVPLQNAMERNAMAKWLAGCLTRSPESFINWVSICAAHRQYVRLVEWMTRRNWHTLSMRGYSKIAKQLHSAVRRSRLLPPGLQNFDIDSLLYLNLMNGRYMATADPDLESLGLRSEEQRELSRSAFHTPNHKSQMYEEINKQIQREMNIMAEKLPRGTDLLPKVRQEFYHLGASGSVSGAIQKQYLQHIPMEDYARESLSKTIAMNELSNKQMASMLSDTTPCSSTLVWKTESDKLRMMLPDEFTHWLQENTLLGLGEANYFAGDPSYMLQLSGVTEAVEIVKRWVQVVTEEVIEDLDYTDFNITHLKTTMQNVWLSLGRALPGDFWVVPEKLSVPDLCRVLAQRLTKQYVNLGNITPTPQQQEEFPALKHQIVEALYGLYTGWRSTMFLNTMLNKVYFEACVALSMDNGGYKEARRIGDDGHNTLHTVYSGLRQMCALQDADLELNASKQFLGVGKAELVRVTTSDQGIIASPVRAITSMTSSDMQAPPCVRSLDAARALYDSVSNVLRRLPSGGTTQRWWQPVLHHWNLVWARDPTNVQQRRLERIPAVALHSSTANGGMGLWLPGDPWFEIKNNIPGVSVDLPNYGTKHRKALCAGDAGAYVSQLVVGATGPEIAQIVDSAIEGNFQQLGFKAERKTLLELETYQWIQRWRETPKRVIQHPAEIEVSPDPRVQEAVLRTIHALEVSGSTGVPLDASDPVQAVADLMAAGVKGVVNLIPRIVQSMSSIPDPSLKLNMLVAMIKTDKQSSLNRLRNEMGDRRVWRLVTGLSQATGDLVWHATPQMAGVRIALANHLARVLSCDVVDVLSFDYTPLLYDGWCTLSALLRNSRLGLRY